MRIDAHQEIGRRLAQELADAQREYSSAAKKFNAIVGEVPSGLPHPDGALRLEQSGKESRRALDLYSKALKRFADFVMHGVVPEDFESEQFTEKGSDPDRHG